MDQFVYFLMVKWSGVLLAVKSGRLPLDANAIEGFWRRDGLLKRDRLAVVARRRLIGQGGGPPRDGLVNE